MPVPVPRWYRQYQCHSGTDNTSTSGSATVVQTIPAPVAVPQWYRQYQCHSGTDNTSASMCEMSASNIIMLLSMIVNCFGNKINNEIFIKFITLVNWSVSYKK